VRWRQAVSAVVVNGFFVGAVYGLLAVGLVVVYRGSRVINFAYGETGMLAAFVFAELRGGLGANRTLGNADHGVVVPLLIGLVVGAGLGAATEYLVARPLRTAPRLQVMVGTIALGSLFVVIAARRWGSNVQYTKPLIEGKGVRVAGLSIQPGQLLIAGCAVTALGGLWALYRFSAFGLRLRAAALDPFAAGLVGVNIDRTSMATWALAGALGGVSAILIAPLEAFSTDFMTALMIRAVAAALIGGLTSISGAFGAGILLGVGESVIAFKSPVTGITDAVIAALILVLIFLRPSGLVRSGY
jgi:branched-subunit amino acid ABC-type transport system permease component